MAVSYDKLFKILQEKGIKKTVSYIIFLYFSKIKFYNIYISK